MHFSLLWCLLLWDHQLSGFCCCCYCCWCSQLPWVGVSLVVFCVVLDLWLLLVKSVFFHDISCVVLLWWLKVLLSILCWHSRSLNVYIMLDHALLAFIVSNEKAGVILISLPLYVTWPFSFAALKILSLLWMFSVLIIMCWGNFILDSVHLVFCKLLVFS